MVTGGLDLTAAVGCVALNGLAVPEAGLADGRVMLSVVAERVSGGLLQPPPPPPLLLTLLPLLAAAAKLCLATRLIRWTLGDDVESAFFLDGAAATAVFAGLIELLVALALL